MTEQAQAPAQSHPLSPALAALVGAVVVIDLHAPYVCLGILVGADAEYLIVTDADLHDLRDSTANRETYVYDSLRFGIRRNRSEVLVKRSEVVAIARFSGIAES